MKTLSAVILVAVCVCVAGAPLGGCETAPAVRGTVAAGADITPLGSRIDAVPGRPLLIPVRAAPGAPARVPVTLSDGTVLQGRLWTIVVEFDGGSSWLPPAGRWRAVAPPSERGASAPGAGALVSLMVMVDVPLRVAGGEALVGAARVRLNVLGPLGAPGTVSGPEDLGLLEAPGAPLSQEMLRLVEPERRSPVRRWRARLLTREAAAGDDSSADPVIEALAVQEEARWSWALRSLARSDRGLARRLAARLTECVDFWGGVRAPSWPTSQEDLDGLLNDLLDPGLDGPRRAQRVEAFLLAGPVATAWMIDDAGTPDAATGRPMFAVGVANLGDRAVLAAAAQRERFGTAEPVDVAPRAARRIFVAPGGDEDAATPEAPALTAGVGSWRADLAPLGTPLVAAPPGLAVGPFLAEYTLESWKGASTGDVAVPRAWATAAMLQRRGRAWTLFVECARPREGARTHEDTVRVWIGPTARPRLVVRVGESGYAHVEQELRPAGREGPDPAGESVAARVASREDTWVCEVEIPEWCIEEPGLLRLAIERIDAQGLRSSYPRPVLPWQNEPGRVLIETRAWGK